MKIAVMSDLHLEFDAAAADGRGTRSSAVHSLDFYLKPPPPKADILILAGDIHSGSLAVDWAREHFAVPTILICGNHEPYGREIFRTISFNRQKARADGKIVFLERAKWEYAAANGDRARFIGTTLWTDFRLYGTPEASMRAARERLEDFKLIKIERGYSLRQLDPSDTARLHKSSVSFLRKELAESFEGATVVITHHAPSPKSIDARFQGDELNPAFATNLDWMIEEYQPALWIHGHMHDSVDYTIGRTRIVCNPRGYFPDQLNPRFDPGFVVEIHAA